MMSAALAVLTIAGHTAGDGSLPTPIGLVLVSCFAFALAFAVSDRRRSFPWLLGYLLAAQVLLHVLLTFAASHGHAGSSVPMTGMVAGHAVGGLAAALVLAYADDLIACWAMLLAHVLGTPPVTEALPSGSPCALRVAPPAVATRHSLRHHVERRGPPALAAMLPAA